MITLPKRTRRIVHYLDSFLDMDDIDIDKCRSAILKNLQHVRRGTIDQALSILRQDIPRDEAIRRINIL